ncbi:MAG: lytic transglycosylase domain-containing protein [Clostridiales bacterium]|jgi:soluble lytic murein transglycosylase-like protein|nr:lytic transglycosylase domain-containing protein [Clostridiales bacterium]
MIDPMSLYNEIASGILSKIPNGEAMYSRFVEGRTANAASASRAVAENAAGSEKSATDGNAVPFSALVEYFTNGGENADEYMRAAIESEIEAAATRHNIDPNLIRAVIRAESNYRYDAVSHAGAMGLMQLMPGTAASLGVTDPFNIGQNINGGTEYLRKMLDMFNEDVDLALAAYNAGPGAVQRHDGIPPFAETQNHVPRVRQYYEDYTLQQYQRSAEDSRFN